MTMNQVYHEVYDYLYVHGRSELDEIIDAIDNDPNTIYGACKHLRWDDYLGCDTSTEEWWIETEVPGLCPECNGECGYGDTIELVCTECDWEQTWTCGNCGAEEHDAIEFEGVEIDVTCESVYITPVDGGNGFAFTHGQFQLIIDHFAGSDYAQ